LVAVIRCLAGLLMFCCSHVALGGLARHNTSSGSWSIDFACPSAGSCIDLTTVRAHYHPGYRFGGLVDQLLLFPPLLALAPCIRIAVQRTCLPSCGEVNAHRQVLCSGDLVAAPSQHHACATRVAVQVLVCTVWLFVLVSHAPCWPPSMVPLLLQHAPVK
jgi:hypothetical protein